MEDVEDECSGCPEQSPTNEVKAAVGYPHPKHSPQVEGVYGCVGVPTVGAEVDVTEESDGIIVWPLERQNDYKNRCGKSSHRVQQALKTVLFENQQYQ